MKEATKVTSTLKEQDHAKKLYVSFSDTTGETVEVKMGMTVARSLIKQLFYHVDPNWGGERKGAGKRKE